MRQANHKTKSLRISFNNSQQAELFTTIFEKYTTHLQYGVISNLNSYTIKLAGAKQKVRHTSSLLKQLAIEIKQIFLKNDETQISKFGFLVLSAITKGSLSQKNLILGLQFTGFKAMVKDKALYSNASLDEIVNIHSKLFHSLRDFKHIKNAEFRRFFALIRLLYDLNENSILAFLQKNRLFVEKRGQSYFAVSLKHALDEVKENLEKIRNYKDFPKNSIVDFRNSRGLFVNGFQDIKL